MQVPVLPPFHLRAARASTMSRRSRWKSAKAASARPIRRRITAVIIAAQAVCTSRVAACADASTVLPAAEVPAA